MTITVAALVTVVRAATAADRGALERLIEASARALSRGWYDAAQTEAAIRHVFGVDSELVADGTYLVAERDGALVGCGGWSRRATLFGGDRFASRSSAPLDPASDAARIRAFFVAADHVRTGIATTLLAACEAAAGASGFARAALMATLPGVPFYRAHGYRSGEPVTLDLDGVMVRFEPMTKAIVAEKQQPPIKACRRAG